MNILARPAAPLVPPFQRRLAEEIGSRDNRIDQLRLVAALAVVLGHSWHIALGPDAKVPLQEWTRFGFHSLAVHVFFFLSGLLVTQSALRHANRPIAYIKKRALRILPALVANAVLVPVILVLVGAWTGVGATELARYALRLATMFFVQFEHPGAFADNPFAGAINGSVWSLRHEIIVYAMLLVASLSGALVQPRRRAFFMVAMLAYIIAGYLVAPFADGGALFLLAEGRHVMASFLLGVLAHQFAGKVPLHPVVAIPGATLWAAGTAWDNALLADNGIIWLTCAATLLIAFPKGKAVRVPHDVSYGVYIWSWPVQQLTVFAAASAFGMALAPMALFFLCLGPLLAVSFASWLWIERPALAWAK